MSVLIEKDGEITVVTLDRPDVRNAVDSAHARALYEAFLAFDTDDSAKVAVFHGAHGHFCAGWDLQFGAKMLRAPPPDGQGVLSGLDFQAEDDQPLGPMGPSRLLLSKPVIAAVSGAAVAGGMELALWCDLRVMEDDAYFGVYCRRFGVPLIDGGTVRLPRLIGMGHAMDLILTGRKVEAAEALQMGLCNRVVPRARRVRRRCCWPGNSRPFRKKPCWPTAKVLTRNGICPCRRLWRRSGCAARTVLPMACRAQHVLPTAKAGTASFKREIGL